MDINDGMTWTKLCNLFYVFFILMVLIIVCLQCNIWLLLFMLF